MLSPNGTYVGLMYKYCKNNDMVVYQRSGMLALATNPVNS